MAFTLADFEPVLRALQEIKQPPHAWVGGQAIIVWANRFLTTDEITSSGLKVPLTSKDGDLKSSEKVARFLADALKGTVQTYRLKDTTRGTAWGLRIELNGVPVIIDVLEKLPGVNDPSYVFEIKAGLPNKSLTAKVIDPISLLLNKADVWNREKDRPKVVEDGVVVNERYDKEHLVLLSLLIPKYLAELESWQVSKTHLKTTVEAERRRLQDFLAASPSLPNGVSENLSRSFPGDAFSDDGHGLA
jgi:hypothetical protein